MNALAEDASVEIGRLDAELVGEVSSFASVLLRSESAASSMIENLTASALVIALAELGSTDRRNVTEIVGNLGTTRARRGGTAWSAAEIDTEQVDVCTGQRRAWDGFHTPVRSRTQRNPRWPVELSGVLLLRAATR